MLKERCKFISSQTWSWKRNIWSEIKPCRKRPVNIRQSSHWSSDGKPRNWNYECKKSNYRYENGLVESVKWIKEDGYRIEKER